MPKPPPGVYTGDSRVRNAREQMALNRLRGYLLYLSQNIPERMTTVERLGLPDPEDHRFVWDLDLQEMFYWDAGTWFLIGPGGAGLDELVKISATDTTADFLLAKLAAGPGINLVPQNVGANETLRIDNTGTGGVTGFYADGGVAVNDLVSMQTGVPIPTVIPTTAVANAAVVAGFVSNVAAGVATVQYAGELGGFVGLSPHTEYYAAVGVPGSILPNPPPAGNIRRKVGIAKDATTLVIRVDADYLIQA
jgi:hypothetical protein